MRETTTGGITLQYPDAVAFAFMPARLIFSGSGLTGASVSMVCGSETQTAKFSAISGALYCDVRAYLQSFFDGVRFGVVDYSQTAEKTELGKVVNFTVNAYAGSATAAATFSFSAFVVWGALKFGETWNGLRDLAYFVGYPFSVGFYATGSGALSMTTDGSGSTQFAISEQGLYNIIISNVSGSKVLKIYDNSGLIQQATFDKTFDFTFWAAASGTQTLRAKIDVITPNFKHPYYLRWIDRAGFYNYWLFDSNDDYTAKATASGDYTRNDLLAYDDAAHGFKYHGGRQQAYTREDSIPLCAPMIDSDTFDRLLDLCTSPVVDLYKGLDSDGAAIWEPVIMTAGSYTKAKDDLQDFVCNMTLPEIATQKL